MKRLAEPCDIAVSKDTEATREEWVLVPIAGYVLILEISDCGLS